MGKTNNTLNKMSNIRINRGGGGKEEVFRFLWGCSSILNVLFFGQFF